MRFVVVALLISLSARAETDITWYSYHQPPAVIYQGPHAGQGYVDLLLKQIIESLPQYQHHKMQVTLGRIEQDMKMAKPVCFAAMARTPKRETYTLFSRHFMMQPGLRLIASAKVNERIGRTQDDKGPVDLEHLLKREKLTLGTVGGRSYGPHLDAIIRTNPNQIISRVDNSNLSLFQMLDRGRIDVVISYPHEANYALEQLATSNSYVSVPIQGIPQFSAGGIGCSRSQWGEQVIADINRSLAKLTNKPTYLETMTTWLDSQVVTPQYYEFYQQHILDHPEGK